MQKVNRWESYKMCIADNIFNSSDENIYGQKLLLNKEKIKL